MAYRLKTTTVFWSFGNRERNVFGKILDLAVEVYAGLAELTELLQLRDLPSIRCGSMDGQLEIMQATEKEQQKEIMVMLG